MKPLRIEDKPLQGQRPAKTFVKPFTLVGLARTESGYVTVCVRMDEFGKPGALVIGQPQVAPFGQPYVAGEAKRLLQLACGAQ